MAGRSRFTSEQKVKILREYLENGASVSQLSEQYKIHPNVIYKWKNDLFEGALKIFSGEHKNKINKEEAKIKQLETKLKDRDSLITEIVSENIQLKKTFAGES